MPNTPRAVLFSSKAFDFLEILDAKRYRQIVRKALNLSVDASPADAKLLKNSEYHRADIGEFRILYRFNETTVYIDIIGKRNDDEVYKSL